MIPTVSATSVNATRPSSCCYSHIVVPVRTAVDPYHRLDADGEHDNTDL